MPLYSLACAAVTSDDHSLKREKVLTTVMQNVWDERVHDGTKNVRVDISTVRHAVHARNHRLQSNHSMTSRSMCIVDAAIHNLTSTVDAMLTASKTNVSVSRVLRLNYELQHQLYTCFLKSSSDWIVIDDCVRALRVVPY